MKKSIKNSLSFIISLLTMFVILVASISLVLDRVVLNEETYINIIKREEIVDKVENRINENLDYLLISNNIPTGSLKDVIHREEIENQIYDSIYFTVKFMKNRTGEIPKISSEVYEQRIDDKINEIIKVNKENIGDEFYSNLEGFKNTCLNIVIRNLEFIDMNALSQSSVVKLVAKASSIVSNIKFFASVILAIVLLNISHFIIWRTRKSRRFAWIGYPFISSGIIIALIGYSGFLSKFYENMPINVDYIKNTSIFIMQTYLLSLAKIGLSVLCIGILFISAYWAHLFKRYRKKA